MTSLPRATALALIPLALSAASAPATLLFDNHDPSLGYGTTVLSELESINQVGNGFTLTGDSILQTVEWWGEQGGTDFSIRVFDATGGTPASAPLVDWPVSVTGTPEDFFGQTYLHYVATVPATAFDAGAYALSIVDRVTETSWYWAASCEDGCEGQSWRRTVDGQPWAAGNFEFAFRLHGGPATALSAGVLPGRDAALATWSVPNPARDAVRVHFTLDRSGPVTVDVFDVRGAHVSRLLDAALPPGTHAAAWDARDHRGRRVAPGRYTVRVRAGAARAIGQLTLVR